jgi:MYXO-CTERM domain-containing protein
VDFHGEVRCQLEVVVFGQGGQLEELGDAADAGCGCRVATTPGDSSAAGAWLALLGLSTVWRRRVRGQRTVQP